MSAQDQAEEGVALFDFEQWQSADGRGTAGGINVRQLERLTQQAHDEGYAAGFAAQ